MSAQHPLRPASIRRPDVPVLRLYGRRLMLRPLAEPDFAVWSEVRIRNEEWLTKWEPLRQPGLADPTRDRGAFTSRCAARERERSAGLTYPFGLFVDQRFGGEVNVNHVNRGALQSATLGYWIDEELAGHGYIAEALVVAFRFAFDDLGLERLEICIVPRNRNSRRVMEKLQIREEGVARQFLEINGTREDHVRYGFSGDEWHQRRDQLIADWL